jgi:MFS family permease
MATAVRFSGALWPLAASFLIQTTASLALSAPLAVSVVIARAARLPEVAIGYYTTLVYVGALVGTLFTPYVLTRMSVRTVQIAGLGALAVGMLLFGQLDAALPGLVLALIGIVLMGLIYGALVPASAQILSNRFPDRLQPLVVSIKQTGVPVGTAIGAVAAPLLVRGDDWSALPLWLAGGCVVVMVVAAPSLAGFAQVVRVPAGVSTAFRMSELFRGFRIQKLRPLMMVALLYGINQAALTTFLVLALNWQHALSVAEAAGYLAVATLSGAVSRIALGMSASRFGHVRAHLGVLGLVSGIAWAVLLAPDPGVSHLMAGAALLGACAMGWNGLLLAQLATEAPPGESTAAVAAGVSLAYLGVVVGPLLFAAALLVTADRIAAIAVLASAAVVMGAWLVWTSFTKGHNTPAKLHRSAQR